MPAERREPRALVVDDEQDVREMMALVLATEGYRVTPVADGAAAIRALRAEPFDVATIDLRMPGLGGVATLVELRRLAPDLAVVVVSGYCAPAEAERCLGLGAFAVVRKPFIVEQLVETLRRAQEAAAARDRPPGS